LRSSPSFPDINTFYERHSALQNFLAGATVVLGLFIALLELRHSGEANEYRAEQTRLSEKANAFRDKANEYRKDANRLTGEAVELQSRIHQLHEDIERKLTKIRLYARAHLSNDGMKLLVSNLSEFDLWINQVELIVTEATNGKTGSHILGGGTRISHGNTEDGYLLYGNLIEFNGDRSDRFNMKFHVKIVVTGVEDDPVTIHSPKYQFVLVQGKTRELTALEY